MELDRFELLEQIKAELGIVERADDEFTSKELADGFGVPNCNVVQFLDNNEIPYERRKAMADGRRQFVYRIKRGDQ